MRTFVLVLMAFALNINLTLANDNIPSSIVEDKIITIDFLAYKSQSVQVDIVDAQGYNLHSETINTKQFNQRRYNLDALPVGSYTIKLNTRQKVITKVLDVEKAQIKVYDDLVAFKPTLITKDDKYSLNFFAQNKGTTISIVNDNETLFNQTIRNQMSISKTFDLEKLDTGIYYLIITCGDEVFTETIVKS